jgi:hypothetical protein
MPSAPRRDRQGCRCRLTRARADRSAVPVTSIPLTLAALEKHLHARRVSGL